MIQAPVYYKREFSHDIVVEPKETNICKRVLLVALPYIGLYKPAGMFLSIGLGSYRAILDISNLKQILKEMGKKNIYHNCVDVASSVVGLALLILTIWSHPLGMLVTTVEDLAIGLIGFTNGLQFDQILNVVDQSLYIGLFFCGALELLVISFAVQVFRELYKSKKEYDSKRYLECIGHIGMSIIRGRQVVQTAKMLGPESWDRLINYLRAPFEATMERSLELTMKHARPKTVIEKTLLDRIKVIVSTIVYISTLPLNATLWVLGTGLDILMQRCGASASIYLKGHGKEEEGELKKVATWNVCMLFGGLPIPFGGVAPTAERVHDVASEIILKDPDLICLQEVSSIAGTQLFEELKDHYAHFYKVRGLFVASKYRIEKPEVLYLPHSGIVNRVVFSFKVGLLNFFTTHLDPKNPANRQDQIAAFIKKIPDQEPTILLGDLNMHRGKELLPCGFQDSLEGSPVTATDRFMGDPNNDISIDYILGKKLSVTSSLTECYNLDEGWAHSDHKLVTGIIKY